MTKVAVNLNDDGTVSVHMDNMTMDQASILKCYLELDLEEGGAIEDLGFEASDDVDYDEWHDSLFAPTSNVWQKLCELEG